MGPEHESSRNQVKLRLMLAGVPPALVDSVEPDDALALLRAQLLWGDEDPITISELAARAGLDVETCRRARMLLGLPDPGDAAVCRVQEVEAFKGFAAGMELYGAEPVMHFVRVLGSALAAVAEGALSVFGRALTEDHVADGVVLEGDAYTLAAFDALESFQLVPMALQIVAKLQFDLATDRLTGDPGQPRWAAVGFVDLTGSTQSTERLGQDVMAEALTRFEEWAVESSVKQGGRVIKYIGDEVMYITPDLPSAAAVATELLELTTDDEVLHSARAGLAFGPLLSRDGDWYGATVNLASRLVDKAKPGVVLLTGDGADLVEGAVSKGKRRVRDVQDRVELWRIG